MAATRVAVVSGSNKGIGLAIVRGLCRQFDGDVYLTARDEGRGLAAVTELNKEGLQPKFHLLDVTSLESIQTLRKFLQANYGGLDVLINNAAITIDPAKSSLSFAEQAEVTIATNFTGLVTMCNELFPLLRPHARVVNLSTGLANVALRAMSPHKKEEFLKVQSQADIEKLMNQFVSDVKSGDHGEKGWPTSSQVAYFAPYVNYSVSKVGVTALTFVQHDILSKDAARPGILVNTADPGWTRTDLTEGQGTRDVDEGADTILYLALLPRGTTEPAGKFLYDRKERPWE